jgi:large subunit ribosomal protein L5
MVKLMNENPMRQIVIDKVTLNIGVGSGGKELEAAQGLLQTLSGAKAVLTTAKVRNPLFHLKKGSPIGTKTTLRGKSAMDFLLKAFKAKENTLSGRSFDRTGNFSFGVPEYIDFPGAKYDPKIGIIGFDVCVSLRRRGARVAIRRQARAQIGKKHRITRDEAMEFVKGMGISIA